MRAYHDIQQTDLLIFKSVLWREATDSTKQIRYVGQYVDLRELIALHTLNDKALSSY